MEPQIRYAKTSDGVSIAYWTLGKGDPLVFMLPLSHLRLEWQIPEWRSWAERLAAKRQLVRYDGRGSGMSDRNVTDFSLDAQVADLEAVADQLRLDKFALLGQLNLGAAAIAYTARHAERVSSLVLWCSNLSPVRSPQWPRGDALLALMESDWDLYTETMTHEMIGGSEGAPAHRWASVIRASMTQEAWRAAIEASWDYDVSRLLPEVGSPTLVLQRRDSPAFPIEVARTLATEIPNARLVILEGSSLAMYLDDAEVVATIIDDFLGDGEAQVTVPGGLPSGTAIILFADIADSTALTERLGDAAFRTKARELDGSLRAVIRDHSGTPIEGKLLGDGVLAVFNSARQSIEAALACGRSGNDAGLPLHLGLHAGDVIREEGNVYGGAVNIASRIAGLSAAGEVLVSETVRSLARTSAGVTFEDRGEQALKGVGEAVRVWAVRQA
jgi:class 3 adenylate cyclase